MNIAQKVLVACIRVYQRTVSPDHGFSRVFFPSGACCYYPSCSEYTKQAIKKYGAIKGCAKGSLRVLRCHPFTTPRVDKP